MSNDAGKTLSESSAEITFRRDLPRLLKLVRPEIIFADAQPVDLTIEGKNFFTGMVLTATSGSIVETSGHCNITSSQHAQCFGLVFRASGSYKLGFKVDQDAKKVGSANLRINVVESVII